MRSKMPIRLGCGSRYDNTFNPDLEVTVRIGGRKATFAQNAQL